MHWGKRHYHRESYFTRKRAASKRRLKKKLIPGYDQHRKYSFKQWQNRVYQRRYRRHTYPSRSERIRAWSEGRKISYGRPRKRYSRVSYTKWPKKAYKANRIEPSSYRKHSNTNATPGDGAIGCGCFSVFFALFVSCVSGNGTLGLLTFVILLIIDWLTYRSNKKTARKRQADKKGSSTSNLTEQSAGGAKSQSSSCSDISRSLSDSARSSNVASATVTIGINASPRSVSFSGSVASRIVSDPNLASLNWAVESASASAASDLDYDLRPAARKVGQYSGSASLIEPLKQILTSAGSAQTRKADASAQSVIDSFDHDFNPSKVPDWNRAYQATSQAARIKARNTDQHNSYGRWEVSEAEHTRDHFRRGSVEASSLAKSISEAEGKSHK